VFRERLFVSKRTAQKLSMLEFDHRTLVILELKKSAKVSILNNFTAFKDLDDNADISRVWERLDGI
jgi:hypothetical protein